MDAAYKAADAKTLTDAKGYADTKAGEVNTALETYKTSNDAAVKANSDAINALETSVGEDLAALKTELQGEIDSDVAAAKTELTTAYGNADAALKTELTTAIGTAKSEAIADAKTETEAQVSAAKTELNNKIDALTTDDIEGGSEVWFFNCGGASE